MAVKKWSFIEELPEYPAISTITMGLATRQFCEYGFPNAPALAIRYKNGSGPILVHEKEWRACGEKMLQVLLKEPERYDKVHKLLHERGLRLKQLNRELRDYPVKQKTNAELVRSYERIQDGIEGIHLLRGIAWTIEQPNEFLTQALLKEIGLLLKKQGIEKTPAEILAILSAPTEKIDLNYEEEAVLSFASRKKEPSEKELEKHLAKYGALTYGTIGPGMTLEELKKRISVARFNNPGKQIREKNLARKKLKAKKRALLNQLKPDKRMAKLLEIAEWIGYDKGWSKEIQFAGHVVRDRIIKELASRLNLTRRQFYWLLPDEIGPLFVEGKGSPSADELNERWKNSALILTSKSFQFIVGKKLVEFDSLMEMRSVGDAEAKEIRGRTAVPGFAKGTVKHIEYPRQLHKMHKGDVLVSSMTIPEIVPAMRIASAIVTDEGGLTCHAAIISRELGIPCVIGTKIATKLLKDGDVVEVDATNGVVKKI